VDTSERIETLQKEIAEVKQQIQALLIDIRIQLLDAQSPIQKINESNFDEPAEAANNSEPAKQEESRS